MTNRYLVSESHKDSQDRYERGYYDTLEAALEAYQNLIRGADEDAKAESTQRVDSYWHNYYLTREVVDEDGEAVEWEDIDSYTSHTFKRGERRDV